MEECLASRIELPLPVGRLSIIIFLVVYGRRCAGWHQGPYLSVLMMPRSVPLPPSYQSGTRETRYRGPHLATLSIQKSCHVAAVADHGYPDLTRSKPNIIGGTNAGGTLNWAASITASFFTEAYPLALATTGSVTALGDLCGFGSGNVSYPRSAISRIFWMSRLLPMTAAWQRTRCH